MSERIIKPIGYVKNDFKEKFGIPRQSGRAPSAISRVIFYPEYRSPDALRDIEGFSHLWLLFDFSMVKDQNFTPLIRPPRLGGNKKVGVFASRSPFRPNHIGLSSVRLIKVEQTCDFGLTLLVSGADLLDGTPIYDVKPYLPFTDCHTDAIGGYADAQKDYKLRVNFPNHLKNLIPNDKIDAIVECLADDPRPSYQEDGKNYGMRFGDYDIKFNVVDGEITVTDVISL
ncbi:MAG: tRNA (N6-threonylcarbamoyladenosine(37)-N6)-methyltransferase TrmO [Clostridia bacterium]|nr:tRNA (N6-threonylcarbamoyladenosine(37)-N6)-methyltransferase TrmO [Clostridia bacterium]